MRCHACYSYCNSVVNQLKNALLQVLESVLLSVGVVAYKTRDQLRVRDTIVKAVDSHFKQVYQQLVASKPAGSTFPGEAVHLVARSIQTDILRRNESAKLVHIYILLDLLLCLTELEMADQTTPFSLIEDVLDVLSIAECEGVVSYLETRLDRLVVDLQPSKGKGLILLRFSKELTRRLSKLKHVVFCGRILVLLASVFPLGERSGVNLQGEFNVSNRTEWDEESTREKRMDIDGNAKEDSLFKDVWKIQTYLSKPVLLFEADKFTAFKLHLESIRDAFILLNHQQSGTALITPQTTHQFFPKYLTSRNLFSLELKDPAFRAQLTLQLLIILGYLLTLTTKIRADDQARVKNIESVRENRNLGSGVCVDEVWVSERYTELKEMKGFSDGFKESVETVLRNERNWMRSCAPFDLPTFDFSPSSEDRALLPAAEVVGYTVRRGEAFIGTDDMSKLWKQGRHLDRTLVNPSVSTSASLKTFLAPLDDQITADGTIDEDIEPEYYKHRDELFNWRAYRIATRGELELVGNDGVDSKQLVMGMREREKEGAGDQDKADSINNSSIRECEDADDIEVVKESSTTEFDSVKRAGGEDVKMEEAKRLKTVK